MGRAPCPFIGGQHYEYVYFFQRKRFALFWDTISILELSQTYHKTEAI